MKQTLTRAGLASVIARDMGLSQQDASRLVDEVFAHIVDALENNETVKIPHFGTFTPRRTPERLARNPKTNEDVWIEPRRIVSFKSATQLKSRIK